MRLGVGVINKNHPVGQYLLFAVTVDFVVIEQVFLIPEQDFAEDLQLVTALPSSVRYSQDMYAVECPRKFALISSSFPKLPQINVQHIYMLDILYRQLVECCTLLVSERLLCSQ